FANHLRRFANSRRKVVVASAPRSGTIRVIARKEAISMFKIGHGVPRLVGVALLLAMLPRAAQDGAAQQGAGQEGKAKLLITFASYRDRPKYPHIFFYEHDGIAAGKITGTVASPRSLASAEAHPWLAQDAKFCAF